jgi:hypothetical protein
MLFILRGSEQKNRANLEICVCGNLAGSYANNQQSKTGQEYMNYQRCLALCLQRIERSIGGYLDGFGLD